VTIFCLSDRLSIRVGRDGIWIWAATLSPEPVHLDRLRLAEMGLWLDLPGESPGLSPEPPTPSSLSLRSRTARASIPALLE